MQLPSRSPRASPRQSSRSPNTVRDQWQQQDLKWRQQQLQLQNTIFALETDNKHLRIENIEKQQLAMERTAEANAAKQTNAQLLAALQEERLYTAPLRQDLIDARTKAKKLEEILAERDLQGNHQSTLLQKFRRASVTALVRSWHILLCHCVLDFPRVHHLTAFSRATGVTQSRQRVWARRSYESRCNGKSCLRPRGQTHRAACCRARLRTPPRAGLASFLTY
jgi:hypothetical protein